MKVVSTPQNRLMGLSRSRTLSRSDRRGQGWHRFAGSFGRGLFALRPPEQLALGFLPGSPLRIRAGNDPSMPLWVRLLLVVALVGLWYGLQRTVPLPFTDADLRTTLSAAASTVGVTGPGDSSGAATRPEPHSAPGRMALLPPAPEVPVGAAKAIRISGRDFAVGVCTHVLTVEQALSGAGVALGALDRVDPALTAPLAEATDIRVVRVRQSQEHTQEAVPFERRRIYDPDLPLGLRQQVQAGLPGTLIRRIETFTEDGEVVSRKVAEDWMENEPRAAVVAYGTKRLSGPMASLEATKNLPRYNAVTSDTLAVRRVLRVVATGYEAGPRSTGKRPGDQWYGFTSIGWRATPGIIAVDPAVIPYRTRLYVPGYGFGIAGDTGSAIVGHRIDLFYSTEQDAARWGRQNLQVYVLE